MKHSLPEAERPSNRRKAVIAGGLLALTVAGIGGAAFAAFTGTTTASQSVSSGTVVLDPINSNAAGNRLTIGATNIAAGDSIQRVVTIKNSGSIDLANVTLDTTATTSSVLDSDAVNGLQMNIDACSGTWVESATPYTYSCSGGTISSVLGSTSVIGTNRALTGLNLAANGSKVVRVTLTLPTGASNAFQNKASTIQYTFTGNQRTGTAQ